LSVYREIVKHSAVYGLGQILSRVASILLLPLYTAYLTPADYGISAVIDLTVGILETLAAGGIAIAVLRFDADPAYAKSRHALWTTGLTMVVLVSTPLLFVAWLFRSTLATLTFGPEVDVNDGASYYQVAIAMLAVNSILNFGSVYLRVLKKSVQFVGLSFAALLLRVALNVWLIVFVKMGVMGLLLSGLIAGGAEAVVMTCMLFVGRPFRVLPELFGKFWTYGWPFIVSGFATLIMHQADRYLLLWILKDMTQVGIYALAYNLVNGVNSLICNPFISIWAPMVFQVHAMPRGKEIIQEVFKYFVLGFFLVLAGVALFSEPIVRILANESYADAARLMPILCLAFLFFPLHNFFSLPATIHRQTRLIATISLLATVIKVAAASTLILALGVRGAAISGVVTYASYSFLGHWRYRQIENLQFPIRWVIGSSVVGVLVFAAMEAVVPAHTSVGMQILASSVFWSVCAAWVLAGPARPLVVRGLLLLRSPVKR
jgi:O-antigen/teichoic acid export membrane protein